MSAPSSTPELDRLRAEWLDLMRRRLPEAAAVRPDWPIRLDHCFGRVILDAVCGRPWREVLRAPAWRHLDEAQLRDAIALAEAILSGEADLMALNTRSLQARRASKRLPSNAGEVPRRGGGAAR